MATASHCTSVMRSSNQITDPLYLEVRAFFLPTLAYASFVPDVPGTHAQLAVCYRTEECKLGSCNCTKS